jgi:hypothetical protein
MRLNREFQEGIIHNAESGKSKIKETVVENWKQAVESQARHGKWKTKQNKIKKQVLHTENTLLESFLRISISYFVFRWYNQVLRYHGRRKQFLICTPY